VREILREMTGENVLGVRCKCLGDMSRRMEGVIWQNFPTGGNLSRRISEEIVDLDIFPFHMFP